MASIRGTTGIILFVGLIALIIFALILNNLAITADATEDEFIQYGFDGSKSKRSYEK